MKKKVMIILCAVVILAVAFIVIWRISLSKKENSTGNSTENSNKDRVNIVYDTAETPVPVPIGYTASSVDGEHTVNSGFVIYEGTEEVTDSNKDTAQATRNQWVWVPVADASEIYGTDSNGQKHGKLYKYSSSGRTALNWTETSGTMSITSSKGHSEPDITSSEENGTLLADLQKNFDNTIESIEKYGGFYIGRYETGGLSGTAKVVKGDTDIANQNWYTMYEKTEELKANNNVYTSMIWGCEWDATLEWLVDSGSKTYSEVGNDSSSWGIYNDSKIPTGNADYTKANNIYDLAGNVGEWTLEAYGSSYATYRGGYYYSYGNSVPVSYRDHYSFSYSYYLIGCRAALYVAL